MMSDKTGLVALVILFMLTGCLHENIEITSEYMINDSWNKHDAIEINKLKIKRDSSLNPYSNLNQPELLQKLEIDSSFMYTTNVEFKPGEDYRNKKIYFNRDNGFEWWTESGERKTKTIGKLQSDTWYEISGLTYYYHIVYIDSINNVHAFVIQPSNW